MCSSACAARNAGWGRADGGAAGPRSGLSMLRKSLLADEHIPRELGFSSVLLEMTLRDCPWQNIIYADSCSSLLQQCPRKCIFQPNICMKYDNRDRAETPSCFLFFWCLYCSGLQVPRER